MTVTVSVSGPSETSDRLQPSASVSGTIITPNEDVDNELSDMPETPARTSGQCRCHSCVAAASVDWAKCFLPVIAKSSDMVSASARRVNPE